MVTTTFKCPNIHLDHVYTFRGGEQIRHRDVSPDTEGWSDARRGKASSIGTYRIILGAFPELFDG